MPRTGSAFLFMLAIMSLAAVVPSSGWAQGSPVRLTDNGRDDRSPSWSQDGTKIAFASDRTGVFEIYVMNADGTNLAQLTQSGGFDPAWSPDGTKIAFSSYQTRTGYRKIYVMNADGTNLVQLTQRIHHDQSPAWSPDGTKIAFTSYRTRDYEIYVMNADGTNPVQLTQQRIGYDDFPAWSPDGTKIAFASSRTGYSGIYVMNADGTNPVQLTQGDSPAWSPDGTKIAFAGDSGIYVMNADGTNLVRLTRSDGFDSHPAWSPDGTKIAFTSNRDGDYDIYVTERGDRRATLLNLSPWQAWVHLYCLKDRGPAADPPAACAVTFECNSFSGEPVAWPVTVAAKTIFTYWPNKTAPDGTAADLHAALVAAGKPEEEARRRTTCEVFSPDPLTVRGYTLFGGQPTLVPVAEPARPAASVEPGERRRQATLPNLSPWQAWVHLYCLKDRAGPDADPPVPCAVTFECNGQSGDPVTWPVEVAPKTIFSYWPNKTEDGLSADLQAALIAAGKPEDEARRRTTCEVSSADPIAVRGYTRFNGQPTLVPVTEY